MAAAAASPDCWPFTAVLALSGCCRADLKFTASSRMKPRWLVIAAVLPTQDVMYVQYNVPTIIMSRSCDQLPKVSLPFLPHLELIMYVHGVYVYVRIHASLYLTRKCERVHYFVDMITTGTIK